MRSWPDRLREEENHLQGPGAALAGFYARGALLVEALELDRVPPALDLALARVHG